MALTSAMNGGEIDEAPTTLSEPINQLTCGVIASEAPSLAAEVFMPDISPSVANDEIVACARAAMHGFMAAFNRRDAEAIRQQWFHFPHVRLHSGQVTVMQRPEDFANRVWEGQGQSVGWGYSAWDYVEVIDAGADKVHFRVQFTRYRDDASVIGSYRSLYVVTSKEGRWAIQCRSSWAE